MLDKMYTFSMIRPGCNAPAIAAAVPGAGKGVTCDGSIEKNETIYIVRAFATMHVWLGGYTDRIPLLTQPQAAPYTIPYKN